MACKDCHHMPSRRNAEYGAACQCKCHDVADAAPDLLAACEEMAEIISEGMTADYDSMTESLGRARAAIAKAKGATS